jgi:hypothetical protein
VYFLDTAGAYNCKVGQIRNYFSDIRKCQLFTGKEKYQLSPPFLALSPMLAARASTARAVSRLCINRNFATVVDSAGYKVAAIDHGQPTSAVTFLVKAGSRYETKPGVAHALKNFAFKVSSIYFLNGCLNRFLVFNW